ncbi:GPR1/FUN34/yaaH family-domain-containing protein [Hypoxylon cercidicola]|nr:GPR1/FUN34/yaaH family-domain-containing protein [Hypoxylon cercidicola]
MAVTVPSDDKAIAIDLERQATASPREQVGLRFGPRNLANPTPLGLLAFATSIFMISLINLQPRGVKAPNIIVGVLVFYGGTAQVIVGIMEFVIGNTFGATLFSSYAAFNLSYALIFIPGSGILAAYTDPETGALMPEFDQAIAMFAWTWFVVSMVFTVATVRRSLVIVSALVFVDITLILLAVGHMLDSESCLKTSAATGFITAALVYWAGAADLWGHTTPFHIPVGSLKKD